MIDFAGHRARFIDLFHQRPEIYGSAPGRVNLIGEHTDYNGGFVLPIAIERNVLIAVASSNDPNGRLYSVQHRESFSPGDQHPPAGSWPTYFLAVVDQFQQRGFDVPPLDVLIDGDVPLGAGLSSSAAYEVAAAMILNEITGAGFSKPEIALLAQAAENGPHVGVQCGIMDQFASANAVMGRALLLDCHTLEFTTPEFAQPAPKIIIINSMKNRGLVESAYNERRAQCQRALSIICHEAHREIPTLRHLSDGDLMRAQHRLTPTELHRVRHNLRENKRVIEFVAAMKQGHWQRAGECLYNSHKSLRDDYEVSCPELDTIVEIAASIPGIHGCRMTGGGFGGCCVALAEPHAIEPLKKKLTQEYTPRHALEPTILVTNPADGAHLHQDPGDPVAVLQKS